MRLFDKLFGHRNGVDASVVAASSAAVGIVDHIDPWMLASAVGAENGSIGSSIGFDLWFSISAKNWVPAVKLATGRNRAQIETALRQFVKENIDKDYRTVLREQETKRGKPASVVIGPGETVTLGVRLTAGD